MSQEAWSKNSAAGGSRVGGGAWCGACQAGFAEPGEMARRQAEVPFWGSGDTLGDHRYFFSHSLPSTSQV
jgi:hypothetical protein